MSWTYDPTLATDLDKVRFNVGDTDTNVQQISDEEITALLASEGSVINASIRILGNFISKYSLRANETVGRISVQYSGIVDNLRKSLDNLSAQNASIYCGGLTKSGKAVYQDNTDLVQPVFKRGTGDDEA